MKKTIGARIILFVFILAAGGLGLAADAPNLAPMIDEISDVVIGDAEGTSAANVFVFPECVNLDLIGNDDHTTRSALIWSYSGPAGKYLINGAEPVNPAVDDLVHPPAAKRIDLNTDPLDPTGPKTITLRDNLRSPIDEAGGRGPYSNRNGSTGTDHPAYIDSAVLTLYASDGSTVSLAEARSFVVYTLDNGYDRISYRRPPFAYRKDFRVDKSGWSFVHNSNSITSQPETALCITGHKYGVEDASWMDTYGTVDLVRNSAYELIATVTTSNANAFSTPMWMIVYDNISRDGKWGHDEYGGEIFFVDNEGGANSPINGIGRSEFRSYLMPIAQQTPQFSASGNGFYTTLLDRDNDMRLHFRMMGLSGYSYAPVDPSSVCMQDLTIYHRDLGDLVNDELVYSVDHFTDAKQAPLSPNGWQFEAVGQGSTLAFVNGSVTISPATDWNTGTVTLFRPGDLKWTFMGTDKDYIDNWPIPWVANQLYEIDFMLSAPSAAAELTPPDVIRVGADTLTAELTCDNFAVPNTPDLSVDAEKSTRGLSMPRFGAPQKYSCFFYAHSVTRTSIPDGARWRPRFEVLTSKALQPMARKTNPTGVTVHGVTVKRVHFSR